MTKVVRIFLKRGKQRRKFVLFSPPFPGPGETVTTPDGSEWEVVKTENDEGFVISRSPAGTWMGWRIKL